MMTAMTQRARHQALTKKNLQMSLIIISHLATSRELKIQSCGGMRTKQVILVCHIWQRIFLVSRVSFFFLILILKYLAIFLNIILAALVTVEHVFSKGHLLLLHIWNHMSAQSMHALLCLGAWSKLGYVEIDDLTAAASLPDVTPDEIWLDKEWGVVG